MLIQRLELFLTLARERHFGRAAEVCGVTQPTLSSAVKQLEDSFGVMLVRRGSRFHDLTPEGEQVLGWARRIVGDAHAMREELRIARHGLSGCIRIAAIPTALAMVARLTTPFREKYPDVTFSVLSRTSVEILSLIGNFDVDVGITYLDNEPLGRVSTTSLYRERYHLITATGTELSKRKEMTWAEAARLPLCLLTPDMQNRRIIDGHLAQAGAVAQPVLESNSMIVLLTHVRDGGWSSIMPCDLANAFDFPESVRAVPLVSPAETHMVGIVAARRDPQPLLVEAFLAEARRMSRAASNPPVSQGIDSQPERGKVLARTA